MKDVTAIKNLVLRKIKPVDENFDSYATTDKGCIVHVKKGQQHKYLFDESVLQLLELPINERIKARRTQIGMSQLDLAQKAGVTQAMIAIIESGNSVPTLESVYKLKKALAVDITFFDDVER